MGYNEIIAAARRQAANPRGMTVTTIGSPMGNMPGGTRGAGSYGSALEPARRADPRGDMGAAAGTPGGGTLAPASYQPRPAAAAAPAAPAAPAFRPALGGSAGGGFSGPKGPLTGQIQGAYGNLIRSGGQIMSPSERAAITNQASSAINRGTQDALEATRADAIRRGDTSLSSIGDTEARIRGQGAANAERSNVNTNIALSREAMENLRAALGGGSQFLNAQAQQDLARQGLSLEQARLLLAQQGQQFNQGQATQGMNLQTLQALQQMLGSQEGLSPEMLAALQGLG